MHAARASEELIARAHVSVEEWLLRALPTRDTPPSRLHGAMHDAVFPGGRRARPLLCRLVADSYGKGDDELVGRLERLAHLRRSGDLTNEEFETAKAALLADARRETAT